MALAGRASSPSVFVNDAAEYSASKSQGIEADPPSALRFAETLDTHSSSISLIKTVRINIVLI
jgi:hypothetical protein